MKSRLFSRNADSRLTSAGGPLPARSGRRQRIKAVPATSATKTPARNQAPIADWVNEWTDSTTPDRVRNVPSRVSVKVVNQDGSPRPQ